MTTEQAVKAIQSHLAEHIEEVPERLLENIKDIINSTRLIIKKEVICENFKTEKPNLKKEWAEICKLYDLDPVKAKKGRQAKKISAKAHFVRKIILTYKYVTLIDLKNFRALVFPAIELLWKIFSRGIFIIVYSFVSLLMLFLIGGLGYAGLLHLWKML